MVVSSFFSTNRTAGGTNANGETSRYAYNGLGHLVGSGMTIQRNNYGYTGTEVEKTYALDYTSPLANVIMEPIECRASSLVR